MIATTFICGFPANVFGCLVVSALIFAFAMALLFSPLENGRAEYERKQRGRRRSGPGPY